MHIGKGRCPSCLLKCPELSTREIPGNPICGVVDEGGKMLFKGWLILHLLEIFIHPFTPTALPPFFFSYGVLMIGLLCQGNGPTGLTLETV